MRGNFKDLFKSFWQRRATEPRPAEEDAPGPTAPSEPMPATPVPAEPAAEQSEEEENPLLRVRKDHVAIDGKFPRAAEVAKVEALCGENGKRKRLYLHFEDKVSGTTIWKTVPKDWRTILLLTKERITIHAEHRK